MRFDLLEYSQVIEFLIDDTKDGRLLSRLIGIASVLAIVDIFVLLFI